MASQLPPHTDEQNRHRPNPSHPGNPMAWRHAAATAATA